MKRKLTRQTLDELAQSMECLTADEQRNYVGGYNNDCFWKCVAYANNSTNVAGDAELYARFYFSRCLGRSIDDPIVENFIKGQDLGAMTSGYMKDAFFEMAKDEAMFRHLFSRSIRQIVLNVKEQHCLIVQEAINKEYVKCYDPTLGREREVLMKDLQWFDDTHKPKP